MRNTNSNSRQLLIQTSNGNPMQNQDSVHTTLNGAPKIAAGHIVECRTGEESKDLTSGDTEPEFPERIRYTVSSRQSQDPVIPVLACFERDSASNPVGLSEDQRSTGEVERRKIEASQVASNGSGPLIPGPPPTYRGLKTTVRMVIHTADEEVRQRVAKLDTASQKNIVSQRVVKRCRLRVEGYDGPSLRPLGRADTSLHPIGQTTFEWHVCKRQRTYTTTFAVLEDELCPDFDIILGEREIEERGFYKNNDEVFLLEICRWMVFMRESRIAVGILDTFSLWDIWAMHQPSCGVLPATWLDNDSRTNNIGVHDARTILRSQISIDRKIRTFSALNLSALGKSNVYALLLRYFVPCKACRFYEKCILHR